MGISSSGRLAPDAGRRRLLLASPVGPLLAEYDGEALLRLHFWTQGAHPPAGTRVEAAGADPLGRAIAERVAGYFAGTVRTFDLPLRLEGTSFQRTVWSALAGIPYGTTVSYAEVGEWVGVRNARAVGQANARNPVPIVIPCHRVLTAGGGLGGYMGAGTAGEGAAIKRWLLRHEGVPGI